MTSVPEELNKSILDDDFIKIFKPLIYVQTILGSVRVNIRHKFVSPPLWSQTVYSVLLLTFSLYSHYYMTYCYFLEDMNIRTEILNTLQACIGVLLGILVMIVNNFVNRDSNTELFLMLQEIDRELKVIGKGRHNRKIYVFVILGTTIIIINHLSLVVVWVPFMHSILPTMLLPVSALSFFIEDFETLLFITVLLYMNERVMYIKKLIDFNTAIRWQQLRLETQVYQRIWQAFNGVVKAIRLTEKLFGIFVLLLVTHLFIYHLMAAGKVIITPEITKFQWAKLIVAPDYLSVKFITRICLISILVNHVEINVIQTKESCIHALEKISNASSRHYMKNMIRVISTSMAPMTVFRMFHFNNLAVQFITLTVKYVIVLLQFSFTQS